MRILLLIIVIGLAAYFGYAQPPVTPPSTVLRAQPPQASTAGSPQGDAVLTHALESHLSNIAVQGRGRVQKILPDDHDGSRHQRFILRLDSGQTILIAHNIDLAPRLSALAEGDTVEFSGEYEWNPKGGVVHWTHHDPAGRHPAGWLKYNGQTSQ